MITLACLDMAGTTVSDDGLVERAFARALAAVEVMPADLPGAEAHVHRTMGLPKEVVFRGLFDDPTARQAVAAFDASVFRDLQDGLVTEVPGATDTLWQLHDDGVAICLTTGFTSEVQMAIIERLGWSSLVDLALAPSDETRGRPYPDLVLTAMLRLRTDDVHEVAVIGDTANDLLTGHRAGAGVVAGVLTGSHSRAELEAVPHTHIIGSVRELPSILG